MPSLKMLYLGHFFSTIEWTADSEHPDGFGVEMMIFELRDGQIIVLLSRHVRPRAC